MSAHPQGGQQGQYDDGYGHGQQQGQQHQDSYYNDDQYGQYHDQQGGQHGYDNQRNDAYYDESCVCPFGEIPRTHNGTNCLQCLL